MNVVNISALINWQSFKKKWGKTRIDQYIRHKKRHRFTKLKEQLMELKSRNCQV